MPKLHKIKPTTVKAVQQITVEDLKQAKQVLFMVSTYGTGEAPDLASNFEKKLMQQNLALSHLNYAEGSFGAFNLN